MPPEQTKFRWKIRRLPCSKCCEESNLVPDDLRLHKQMDPMP